MTQTPLTRRAALKMGAALAASATLAGSATAQIAPPTALVTGCSSGFGRLTALALARAGYTTVATMRDVAGRNAAPAGELAELAATEDLPLRVLELDVRDTDSISAALGAAGPVDVLVNSAGYILAGSIELHSPQDVQAQFDTNLVGYHRLVRAALPAMRARGSGLIVNISSGLGRLVFPTQGWYVATKFAIEGMSEALAYELAPFGVDVSIVQPTQYPTQFLPNGRRYFEDLVAGLDEERAGAYAEQIGITRFGLQDEPGPDPADVAAAIVTLADMAPGSRPLRQIASPFPDGLAQINAGLSAAQDAVFADTPFADWRRAVVE